MPGSWSHNIYHIIYDGEPINVTQHPKASGETFGHTHELTL